MCPPPPGDSSPADEPSPVELVSHHLLLLLDPFGARDSKRVALRWLSGLTSAFLRDLSADPEWQAVQATLLRAADQWLDRLEVAEDAAAREPWQPPATTTGAPSVGDTGPGESDQGRANQEAVERAQDALRDASQADSPRVAPGLALHVASIRELLIDDYDARPHVLPFAGRDASLETHARPERHDMRSGMVTTAAGRQHKVLPDERYAALLPWCLTNHATWVVSLADRFPDRPTVWRRYIRECFNRPEIERAVPTRLARVAVTLCEPAPDRWALLARVVAAVEASLAALPPIELLPTDALPDVVLAVRAPVARVIRAAEVTEPPLVCLAEVLGIVRLLRHASALDIEGAHRAGRGDLEASLRAMRERSDAAELQFERVLSAVLQPPSPGRLLAVAGRAGAEALRYTARRYDAWWARTGHRSIIPPDGRAL